MAITIKWETAEHMMNIVAFAACQACTNSDEDIDFEDIQQCAREIFESYCEAMGITEIEEPEDEEEDEDDWEDDWEEEEEEDDDDEDGMESIIYDCDGHRGISASDARMLLRCVTNTLHAQMPHLPNDILEVFIKTETLRIANEWGIEVVDMSEDEDE